MRLVVVQRSVPQRNELALDVLELDFDVRDRSLQNRRPVHQTLGPVDQAVVVHPLEDGLHGTRESVVHGEALATPVHTVADPTHLITDGATGFTFPVPDFLDELLATEVLLRLALAGELLLDQGLRRDPGVIHSRKPQHLESEHPLAATQRVHQGVVERMPHMQAAGHVRWGQHDRVRGLVGFRVGLEVTSVHPALIQICLYRAGIPAFRQCIGGVVWSLRR